MLESEGYLDGKNGRVDHPDDEGGRTSMGVTQSEYSSWLKKNSLPDEDVYNIKLSRALTIYKQKYWDVCQCEQFPQPLAYLMLDAAILHGVNFAPRAMQIACGVQADGIIGPKTLAAAKSADMERAARVFRMLRWERMKARESFPTFAEGWKKRLNDVDANTVAFNNKTNRRAIV